MPASKGMTSKLMHIYRKLLDFFGPRGWWPAQDEWEIVVGAVLTQNVAWRNVEQAISNLRRADVLDLKKMWQADEEKLAQLILPTRFYQVKARKLKTLVNHLVDRYDGELGRMLNRDTGSVRAELLALWGLGPETVDSILLYAGGHPVFVVDAYTRRIFSRLGLLPADASYDAMQQFFMRHLPLQPQLYNEYHALIVGLGNRICHNRRPRCNGCPLAVFCRAGSAGEIVAKTGPNNNRNRDIMVGEKSRDSDNAAATAGTEN
ncbi:MAG: endonuclease III domain-containing protein [Syntrophomonadaceae bacterium]|nr:endonuclease III domain-containing protein [Syntrophomonadaceae bacterium]